MDNIENFKKKAPGVMKLLMRDFDISALDAAAIVGNLGHESNGFMTLQEIKPLVPGSRGGWGWAQWTGPRRTAFEAWCERKGFDPSSDVANYSFLFRELKSWQYKKATTNIQDQDTLRKKMVSFEADYLKAGVKHYDSRYAWAQRAFTAYHDNREFEPPPIPEIQREFPPNKRSLWARFRSLFLG